MRIPCENPLEVVKEAFWLAWQACGKPIGMGWLQDRPGATRNDVWANVLDYGDYPHSIREMNPNLAYGDYVFGRMMKVGLEWDATGVICADHQPDPDYQMWCVKYPTFQALVEAAIASLTTVSAT